MNKVKVMKVQDAVDMMDKRKMNKAKYRIKVSYGSQNPEDDYRFNLADAMRDKKLTNLR